MHFMKFIDTMKKWCEEGTVELTLTCVHMVGPAGSGKTCTQCLLLDKPLPKHNPAPSSDSHTPSDHTPTAPSDPAPSSSSSNSITNSTPIACKAVKALRVSIDKKKKKKIWKAVSRDELIERLASDLKSRKDELDCKVSQEIKPTSKSSRPQSSSSQEVPTKNEDSGGAVHDSGSAVKQNDSAEHYESGGILKEIADLIPKAKAQLSDEWVYIIDSGGQPAYQELLPLLTRAASLNIVTIDLSKGLDEEFTFTYRINGKEFNCDEKMMYSNRRLFKSVVSSVTLKKPLILPYEVTESPQHSKPKHSMNFVVGTHYDILIKNSGEERAKEKVLEMSKKLMSPETLMPFLTNYVFSNVHENCIIVPVDTLSTNPEERDEARTKLLSAIECDEVSLTLRVPIRIFAFELYLESKAESKGFLTRDEAVQEGKKLYMEEDDVDEALVYLHNCTIILYYPQIKPQLVFVDPQRILDVLSHLLALTYVDKCATQLFATNVREEEKSNLIKKGRFQEALLEKFTAVFTDEFQPGYFIKLLRHLHIIADCGPNTYFLPSALPSYNDSFNDTSTEIKPLHYVWRMKNKDSYDSEFSVPVPQGIFSLIIVHLLNQQKYIFQLPPSENQYRNAFFLLVTVGKKTHPFYIINRHTHIEVHFDSKAKKHCPSVCDLVTKAIKDSSEDISVECNHVNAFPCPKEKGCHCIVEEDEEEGMIVNCSSPHYPSVDISQSDDSYWCWFADKMSASPGKQNVIYCALGNFHKKTGINNDGCLHVVINNW